MDPPTFIKPLTSLRFFAAFMVLSHHYFGFEAGYSGVTFFYVLSGYVLGVNYPALNSERERRHFWWKRFARIYPNHLVTLLIAVPLAVSPMGAFLAQLVLVQSWVPVWSYYFSFNAPAWSISNEAFFYALFPWLVSWLRPSPDSRIFMLGALVVAFAAAWSLALPNEQMDSSATHFLFYIAPPLRTLEFALGVALAFGSRRPVGLTCEIAALLTIGAVAVLPAPAAFRASIAFIPAAVTLVYVFSRSEGPIAKALSNSLFVLLGNASFALYMLHYPLREYVIRLFPWSATVATVTACICIVLSVVMYCNFEKPVQRWLLRLPMARRINPI